MKNQIVIGISGGVDSAVAAYLLKNNGYDVTAVFLKMHGCSSVSEQDAKSVCDCLKIKFISIDVSKVFKEKIEDYFVSEYCHGRTPNPCVRCNAEIKFRALADYADKAGIKRIATGHYCNIGFENGRYYIVKGKSVKDQSYMLSRLSQSELSRCVFPLADMDKEQVRKTAENIGLSVAEKPDSQEICFIPDNDYVSYIKSTGVSVTEGDFLDEDGKTLGKHKGIIYYTAGQRKKLGIALGKQVTVVAVDAENNTVTLSDKAVNVKSVAVKNIVYQKTEAADGLHCKVKLRYSSQTKDCKISVSGSDILCTMLEPTALSSPGQSAVFYDDNGGIILSGEISEVIYE